MEASWVGRVRHFAWFFGLVSGEQWPETEVLVEEARRRRRRMRMRSMVVGVGIGMESCVCG